MVHALTHPESNCWTYQLPRNSETSNKSWSWLLHPKMIATKFFFLTLESHDYLCLMTKHMMLLLLFLKYIFPFHVLMLSVVSTQLAWLLTDIVFVVSLQGLDIPFCFVWWCNISLFTSLLQLPDNPHSLFRVDYEVFQLSPLNGVLQPYETEKVLYGGNIYFIWYLSWDIRLDLLTIK